MLDDYKELQETNNELKKGIVDLAKSIAILTEKYKDISEDKVESIITKLQEKANELISVEHKYMENGKIKEGLLDECEENTSFYLQVTYESSDIGNALYDLVIKEILPLAKEIGDTNMISISEHLLNL